MHNPAIATISTSYNTLLLFPTSSPLKGTFGKGNALEGWVVEQLEIEAQQAP